MRREWFLRHAVPTSSRPERRSYKKWKIFMKTKMTFQKTPLAIALLASLSFPVWAGGEHGHDHDAAPAKSESHADESHDDHDDHDAHEEEEETAHNHEAEHGEHDDEEAALELTAEQQKLSLIHI